MALEDAIKENTEVLKTLITILQSGAAIAATGNAAAATDTKPTKATKPAKADAAAAPAPTPAAAPAPAPAAAASTGPDWDKDVLPKLLEINKSTEPGKGRDAIVALLGKFLPELAEKDRKVPALKALGKNAEILAALTAAPAAEEAGEDDLGI